MGLADGVVQEVCCWLWQRYGWSVVWLFGGQAQRSERMVVALCELSVALCDGGAVA